MQKITPFLWFNNNAQEAAKFYCSVFKNSKIVSDTPMMTEINIDGQELILFNGGPNFSFTPATSLFISCETQEEIDAYWNVLTESGKPGQCGWLQDKYGLSWQIVPTILRSLIGDPDKEKSSRAMQAMLQMSKLDIAALTKAHDGT